MLSAGACASHAGAAAAGLVGRGLRRVRRGWAAARAEVAGSGAGGSQAARAAGRRQGACEGLATHRLRGGGGNLWGGRARRRTGLGGAGSAAGRLQAGARGWCVGPWVRLRCARYRGPSAVDCALWGRGGGAAAAVATAQTGAALRVSQGASGMFRGCSSVACA